MIDRPKGAGPPDTVPGGERRFVTVVFCDMVGSTALSEQLDPEEFRDILLAFRETCSGVISRFGGYLARYIGDALLIYFGFPQAHDRDAQLAVSSALGIVRAVHNLRETLRADIASQFGVHIGIHTGLVIAGELVSDSTHEASAIVGETPNIAARLESLAPPDTVYISRATHDLVSDYFHCRSLGAMRIAGLSRPLEAFEVLADRGVRGRLQVLSARRLSSLCGRENELRTLMARWQQTKEGAGQIVLISGEPGIGKSRLVQSLDDMLGGDLRTVLVAYCASHTTNSALFPIIDLLQGQAEIGVEASPAARRDKLETFVRGNDLPGDSAALLAPLLSIPLTEDGASPSPARQRRRTLEILVAWLQREAERRPTIFVIEDLHWADASTIEFLGLLLNQAPAMRLMVILTFRPEFQLAGLAQSQVTHLTLGRLTARDVEHIVDSVTVGKSLPYQVLHEVILRTDGVPLFVEELTKMVIESGTLREQADRYVLAQPLPPLGIPATLRESLMARLDGLANCKGLAQLAATLGREFSHDLLVAVAPLGEAELSICLARLIDAEVLYQKGTAPKARYLFKHSLIQETAYQSLLLSRRKETHGLIARTIEERFPEIATTQPEMLAHHFTRGGDAPKAVTYFQRAGRRALEQSANVEAIAHLTSGLNLLATLPPSAERDETEVDLQLMAGSALIATRGYAAPEVGRTYARARSLVQSLGKSLEHAPVLRGLQAYYQVRGPLRVARELSEEFLRLAEQAGDGMLLVEANRRLGWCLFCLGDIEGGRRGLEASLSRYDQSLSARHIGEYGSDPGVQGAVNLAWLEWFAGHPDAAVRRSAEAVERARATGHSLSLAYALGVSAAVYQCLGRAAEAQELASETLALAEDKEIAYWAAWSTVLEGWAAADQGLVDEGITKMQNGLAAYRSTGAELFRPYSLALLVQVLGAAGREAEALAYIEQALESVQETDTRFFEAELYRLRGAIRLQIEMDSATALQDLATALTIAERQGAVMLELRAALSLVQAADDEGRTGASTRLAQVLARIGDGSGDRDVARARAVLRRLRADRTQCG
jgi:class 3 adenylate cyclase/predicted ATPase